ncbi:MAG: hypothetical protein NTAFB01_14340 [Nitrospira sp.]
MTEKKPYSMPQLFRVDLDQEQAILSACSLMTTSVSQGGNGGCRPNNRGGCKRRFSGRRTDSGPRAS